MNQLKIISKIKNKISTAYLLKDYFFHSILNKEFRKRRKVIEQFNESNLVNILCSSDFDERSLPGCLEVKKNGWFRFMYQRYLMALRYTKGKIVLDSCCGLGWGSYILSINSKSVLGVDNDPTSIKFANNAWKASNINFIVKDIFEFLKTNNIMFDVILAMETIEHFTKEDGRKFLEGVTSSLNSDGIFIGSSFFPKTQKQAEELCAKNPHHLYIYTEKEIKELLSEFFENVRLYSGLFCFASKRKF